MVGPRGRFTAADHLVLVRSPRHYGQHAPRGQNRGWLVVRVFCLVGPVEGLLFDIVGFR